MSVLDILGESVGQRLAWTLLHFLWQGLLVASVAVFLLRRISVMNANRHYAVSLAALLTMAVCPLATFAWLSVGTASEAVLVAQTGRIDRLAISDRASVARAQPVMPEGPADTALR